MWENGTPERNESTSEHRAGVAGGTSRPRRTVRRAGRRLKQVHQGRKTRAASST
jgi:hypothetical protein